MVVPLLKLRVRGVLWYQGESNGYPGVADTYGALLPAFIADWRTGFGQPDLPFLIFQISAYRKPQTDPNEISGIAQLREAQLKTVQATSHTALVVTLDLGEPDVHYKSKEPAADRALKSALALAYGRDLESSGPLFKSFEIAGDKAILRFTHSNGGLVAKDGPLTGFVIAGEDRTFVFADARIEGDNVVVSSAQVAKPVAVRYAWADLPKANLFNQAGLPASSFRTDTWESK
jgi:sialate O-acetylesterase